MSEIIEWAGGLPPDSPIPTPRMGRGASSGLADSHTDARQQQLSKPVHVAGDGGHQTPRTQGEADYIAPDPLVGQSRNGDSEADVKNGKGKTGQQSELRIGKAKLTLDRLLQNHQQLPVHEVDRINEGQHCQGVVAISRAMVTLAVWRDRIVDQSRSYEDASLKRSRLIFMKLNRMHRDMCSCTRV